MTKEMMTEMSDLLHTIYMEHASKNVPVSFEQYALPIVLKHLVSKYNPEEIMQFTQDYKMRNLVKFYAGEVSGTVH